LSPAHTRHDVTHKILNISVIVAALGYFVDIYDLILFSIVRIPSLRDIGVPEDQIKDVGIHLLNLQMIGMLLGGIVWGILGDKKGRMTALFLTILIYSLANIANGFAQTVNQYSWMRIIAGFGLAGELGLGITLVTEVMSKEKRGWGTAIVSGVGIAGAVLAFFIAELGWRNAYFFGGGMGLLLLFLRIYLHESGMFHSVKEQQVKRGDFLSIFIKKKRFLKFLHCILIGLPVWFVVGILVTFSKEFGEYFNISGGVSPGKAVMFNYAGLSIGSFLTGLISQVLKSRKKSLFIALTFILIFGVVYFLMNNVSSTVFYLVVFLLGLGLGYWSVFVTIAAEQFGTNIRSTITTTVPNFVRGSVPLMTLWWNGMAAYMGILQSAVIVFAAVMVISFISSYLMEETFGKDLDYVE